MIKAIPVKIGIKMEEITDVDQRAENYGIVATLMMKWTDPALAFSPNSADDDFRFYTGETSPARWLRKGICGPGSQYSISRELTKNPERIAEAIERSNALQGQIWSHATALPELELKNPPLVALFVNSPNDMFDIQTKRVTTGLFYRIPVVMWIVLLSLTVFSMFGMGYLFDMSDRVNRVLLIVFSLAFSIVILLIADPDRSGAGKLCACFVD